MQIDDSLIAKANQIAQNGEDAEAVIAEALSKLAWERREVAAVMEGIAEAEAGHVRPLEEFGQEMRERMGIELPEA